jgi:hypothetical protein
MSSVYDTKKTTTRTELRALLAELQEGQVGSAISDWVHGRFNRVWYETVAMNCTKLMPFCSKELFYGALENFRVTMDRIGKGQMVGGAKDGTNLRSKSTVQAVLEAWDPKSTASKVTLKMALENYKNHIDGLQNTKREPVDNYKLKQEKFYLEQILNAMAEYCTQYGGGKNVWM